MIYDPKYNPSRIPCLTASKDCTVHRFIESCSVIALGRAIGCRDRPLQNPPTEVNLLTVEYASNCLIYDGFAGRG
jgi:hypothetical protein